MLASFAIAVLVGLFIGVASGLLGIGGGSIMVPVFRLFFGMSAVSSTATSLFTVIPTSLSGIVSHLRGKTCVPKLGLAMGIGGACTSTVGVWLAQLAPSWGVMLGTAIVIAYSASTMLRKALQAPRPGAERAAAAGASGADAASETGAGVKRNVRNVDPSADVTAESIAMTPRAIATCVLIGAVTGVVSGYVGLGGGFLMVPLMMSLMHMPMKLTSGTSLIAIVLLAIPATIMQGAIGNVDYLVGIATACGSIPGAFLGARLVSHVPERTLRFVFAAFLGLGAVLLVVNEFGLFA